MTNPELLTKNNQQTPERDYQDQARLASFSKQFEDVKCGWEFYRYFEFEGMLRV